MDKIKAFLKKYSWAWIIIVVIVAIIGDFYLQRSNQKPSTTPIPVPQTASYKSVIPGVSTEEDLNKILGTPLRTDINGSEKTDEYKATSGLRRHIGIIESGKVVFIKEVVSSKDTTTATSITSIYGSSPNILYSKFPNSSFNLYVYPSNGIAYLGHKDGTLLEIWYFQPTTIQNFLNTWGKDYSITPSTEELH